MTRRLKKAHIRMKHRIGVMSHYRLGTHLLMWLIFDSFKTPYKVYDDIFLTHCPIPSRENTTITVVRPCAQVMPSTYNIRDRLGVGDISFSDFLRTPYRDMPKTKRCALVADFPVERIVTECTPDISDIKLTPLDFWQAVTRNHCQLANLVFLYQEVLKNPEAVIQKVSRKVPWQLTGRVAIPKQKVGWYNPNNTLPPNINPTDAELLDQYDDRWFPRKREG